MYKNLNALMKTCKISQKQLADLLDVRNATVNDKINGKSRFYFEEALLIKKVFFPIYEIEYLFAIEEEKTA